MSGDSLGQDKITEEFYEYKNIKFAMQRELDQVFIIRAPPELTIEGLGTEFWCSGNISAARTTLRISFDDISFCRYRVIFKISLKYRYRIFLENITRYLIMKYWSILAFQWTCES